MFKPVTIPVNFVRRHKVAVAIVGTAFVCTWINSKAVADLNEFLKEHDLYDTFYARP